MYYLYSFDAKKETNRIITDMQDWMKNRSGGGTGAIVAISGGKDSSIVAALACKAYGKENVLGVLLPNGEQSDIQYSKDICNYLGIACTIININPIYEAIKNSIDKNPILCPDFMDSSMHLNFLRDAEINTPARIRMTIVYAIAAGTGMRVLNTCNLSETLVSYETKYGDGTGDYSPLGNYTVTEVKQIGLELGLPEKFINKIPSDGLCGQTDEEKLGFTYDILDKYIRGGVCEDTAIKEKIDALNNTAQHKINLMPKCENNIECFL